MNKSLRSKIEDITESIVSMESNDVRADEAENAYGNIAKTKLSKASLLESGTLKDKINVS